MKRATKYEILRGVGPTSRVPCVAQPSGRPVRIAYLIDEKRFTETGGLLEHNRSVFLEDSVHDWMMRDGALYYFGHAMGIEDRGDIVAVMEEDNC